MSEIPRFLLLDDIARRSSRTQRVNSLLDDGNKSQANPDQFDSFFEPCDLNGLKSGKKGWAIKAFKMFLEPGRTSEIPMLPIHNWTKQHAGQSLGCPHAIVIRWIARCVPVNDGHRLRQSQTRNRRNELHSIAEANFRFVQSLIKERFVLKILTVRAKGGD